jgi:hypothetical protein
MATVLISAAAFFPAFRLARHARQVLLALVAIPILLAPLWVPAEQTLARAVVAIFACLMLFKAYDVHVGREHGSRPDFRGYLAWLPNIFSLVFRKTHLEPRPTLRQNASRAARSVFIIAACVAAAAVLRRVDWHTYPFALEHTLKAILLFILFNAGFALTIHVTRLAGIRTRDFTDSLSLASTPAEFWNRYNRNVSQFLFEDVYKPARRRVAPMRAVLIAFAVSAIAHEYIFSIAVNRVQGLQTLFFLSQGFVVGMTAGWKPYGWRRHVAAAATVAFLLVTSVLFFASFHGAVPMYAGRVPEWLGGQ